ncbi:hypothetical protein ACMCSK_000016 [Campylobacter jejuni]|nr:hypothetical protein [Campylobacter jejuni]MBO7028784.1 hypothetical protein [Campylobacter jejuni]HED4954095.1 hypothetical protein [Campylobacter jejuni]HEE9013628.1 hypothetical protein [Campylobacter jejuni]HEF4281444.1 hypothetical protein [Campylobacter jejuni]
MFKARNLDAQSFHNAKIFGIISLTCVFYGFCLPSSCCRMVWNVDE